MDSRTFDPAIWSLSPLDDCCTIDEMPVGLLSFDKDEGVQMEIPIGSLIDDEADGFVRRFRSDELRTIYGYSRTGKYYALEHACRTGATESYPGMKGEKYHAASLLVSRAPLCPNPKVTGVVLYFEGLREWVGEQPVQSIYRCEKDSGILQSSSLDYDAGRVVEPILYESDEVLIQARHVWHESGGPIPRFEYGFKSEYHISFTLKHSEMPLQEMLNTWVYPVRDFLTFCMGFRSEVTRIAFATTKDASCELYVRIIGSPLGKGDKVLDQMPLPYRAVVDRLPCMVEKWVGLAGYAEHASKSFVALLGPWDMPLSLEFFASAAVLEALSHDVSPDGDQPVLLVDENVLEEVLDSAMRQDVKDAVVKELYRPQNSNDLTKRLLSRLGKYAEYVAPDLELFMKEHRDARNGYAHLNPRKLKKAPQLFDLFVHTKTVQLLCYGALSMRMGMNDGEILKAVLDSRFMSSYLRKSRERYTSAVS